MNPIIPLAICGFLLGGATAAALTFRQRWLTACRVRDADLYTEESVRGLAEWAVDTKITVCSVTGTWVSMTLAELAKSPVPYRSWNVPTSVEIHPRSMDARADEDQAKEHRG